MTYNELDLDDLQEELLAIDVTLGDDLLTSLRADPPVFEDFVTNCYDQNQTGHKVSLVDCFVWDETPEGDGFWSKIYDRFHDERVARHRRQQNDM